MSSTRTLRSLGSLLAAVALPCGAASAQVGAAFELDTYPVSVVGWDHVLVVDLDETIGSGADLYLRYGAPPTARDFDLRSATPGTSEELLTVDAASKPPIRNGTWWIGVRRPHDESYDLSWTLSSAVSRQPGMGANAFTFQHPDDHGVSFRVWAPNADSVHVAGNFNGWSSTLCELQPEGNGNWSMDVRGLDPGARYKYVIRNGGQTLWKNDPRARMLTSSVGDSVVVDPADHDWQDAGYQTPPFNEMVIYEMHVGTFEDVPGGGPGTFASVTSRLDYLADLGVNVIELMPISEFAGDFSWGYNYSHPYSVETAYGGITALRQLVDEAHQRGIVVLLDVLYNHWGPTDLDMWRFDGWSQGPYGGIYFYNDACNGPTPWGDTRPDFGRGEVRQYVRDNVMAWLSEAHVDGMRWDSTSNIRMGNCGDLPEGWSLMQWVNDEVDSSEPWKIQIAEDMYNAPNEWITRPTGAGGAGFDSQWDALFVHPVRAAVETPDDNARDMWAVRNAIAQYYNGEATQRVIFTESHDEVANGRQRVPEEIWPGNAASWFSKKRSTLASTLVFTAPGIPMIFQGQEVLEDGYFEDTDPVDWNKLTLFPGIHQLYKDLIAMRRNLGGVTRGLTGNNLNVHHVNDGDKMIAFHRWHSGGAGDDVVVMANFRNQDWNAYRIGLPHPGLWRVRFNSDWVGYDPSYSNWPTADVTAQAVPWDGMPYSAELSIGAYTAVVLSQ